MMYVAGFPRNGDFVVLILGLGILIISRNRASKRQSPFNAVDMSLSFIPIFTP